MFRPKFLLIASRISVLIKHQPQLNMDLKLVSLGIEIQACHIVNQEKTSQV